MWQYGARTSTYHLTPRTLDDLVRDRQLRARLRSVDAFVAIALLPPEKNDRDDGEKEQAAGDPHDQSADHLVLHWRDTPDPRRGGIRGIEHGIRVRDIHRDDRHRDAHEEQ